ncbi:MAG TPA: DUF5103 domain-containing protein [Puia sp.]|nr:DUF5103 domain-containing protein [Puia sp.]
MKTILPKSFLLTILLFFCFAGDAQMTDTVFMPNIKTPQLFVYGNQLAYPVMNLNSSDKLELHFDDLDADVKNYYYTFQLCNADWTPAVISEFDFIKGFTQIRISEYRFSSISLTKYTHYQAILPDQNCVPTRSGNYLLKIFLNGDTSQLAFTRRFLIVENAVNIGVQLQQPLDPAFSHTHQKLQINVNTRAMNVSNPLQQIKITVLQNYRWDNAIANIQPTFYSGNSLQYNRDDDFIFPGGREWRWIDLQSFRYQSERVAHAVYNNNSTEIFAKPDLPRNSLPVFYYKDYNGFFFIQTTESINPYWQTDYATVHFSFVPPGNQPYAGKDVYIIAKFTDYKFTDSTRMKFNNEKGVYEVSAFLKQGYYNYSYITIDKDDPKQIPSFDLTEGSYLETENDYVVLIYFRELGGRADQLAGLVKMNTLSGQ